MVPGGLPSPGQPGGRGSDRHAGGLRNARTVRYASESPGFACVGGGITSPTPRSER
jgi:hypothetical protein